MFKLALLVAVLVALIASMQTVDASPFFTAPVASTKATGDQKLQIKWTDNGKAPALNANAWGNSTIWLAAGSESTQFKLQEVKADVDPKRRSISFKVDKNIGPSGQYYFIRMEGSKTATNGYPVMSFSARFTLNGMSGQFNSTVLQAAMGKEGSASGSSSATSSGLATSVSSSPVPTNTSAQSAAAKTSDAGRLNAVLSLACAGALALVGLITVL